MSEHFDYNSDIISECINLFMNRMTIKELFMCSDENGVPNNLYHSINIHKVKCEDDYHRGGRCFWYVDCAYAEKDKDEILNIVGRSQETEENGILFFPELVGIWEELADLSVRKVTLDHFSATKGTIVLFGRTLSPAVETIRVPDSFRVLAVIHSYNEADIMERTIQYLLDQNVDLYLIDNWSTDGTFEIMKKYHGLYSDRVWLERFPADGDTGIFDMYHLMERTEQIATSFPHNWFIHYDTDEYRVGFWNGADLRKTLFIVDQLGYNLVENTVIDFRLVDEKQDNIFMEDTWFELRHSSTALPQVKTWKKTSEVDLKTVAGHMTSLNNPRIFPLRILNRHYPYRSIEQASNKVFRDRKQRSDAEYEKKGWHGHYYKIKDNKDFIYDREQLLLWDYSTFDKYFLPLFTGVGIWMDGNTNPKRRYDVPEVVAGKKVVIYGAGRHGIKVHDSIAEKCSIVAWVDNGWEHLMPIECEVIKPINVITELEYDYIIVTPQKSDLRKSILEDLRKLNVALEKIVMI